MADRSDPGDVWLIGGPSGVGKSTVAYRLAARRRVPLVEIDDIVEAALALTRPDEHPVLHHWRLHPEAAAEPPERIVRLQVAIAEALAPGIEAVVANHLATRMPVVIEGDYVLPSTAALQRFGDENALGRVRAVFLVESDEDRLVANYRGREPTEGAQRARATVSRLYGEWLARDARRHGMPVVEMRPWRTTSRRVRLALEQGAA